MKRKLTYCILFSFLLMTGITSCVSPKKIIYFQGAEEVYKEAQDIAQHYQMKLKPADNIIVKISSDDPALLKPFTRDVTVGSENQTGNLSAGGGISNAYGYTVNNDGFVILPAVGAVQVADLTTEEAAKAIEQAVIKADLMYNPEVTVRLLNARVSVVGAVNRPGVVELSSERNSIIDVLAKAGDVEDAGLKQNIRLFRETNGQRQMYTLDLTKVSVFESPAFYVQQNDMIYVQPNRSKSIKSSAFYTYLTAGGSILGVVSSLIAIIALVK
ncbi:MAG: polysaccharide biosynthesis/export family protein [Paraprevotella sp.]|nr:polysaccharide biosynthesis/export family protein [Paraprevotella sp.]